MQANVFMEDLGDGLDMKDLFPVDEFFESYVSKLEGDPHNSISKPGSANLQHNMLATPAMQRYPQDPMIDPTMLAAGDSAFMDPFSGGQYMGDFGSAADDMGHRAHFGSNPQSPYMLQEHHDTMEMDPVHGLNSMGNRLGTAGPYGNNSGNSFQGQDLRETSETSGKYAPGVAKGSSGKQGLKGRYRTTKQQTLNKQAQQRYRQRKKERAAELENAVSSLSSEVNQLKVVKEEKRILEERALELERTVLEKEIEIQRLKMQMAQKKVAPGGSDRSEDSNCEIILGGDQEPTQLADTFHRQIRELEEYLRTHGVAPSQINNPGTQSVPEPVLSEMSKKLSDVFTLCMRLVRLNGPNVWDLIHANMSRAVSFEPAGPEQWLNSVKSLELTDDQVLLACTKREQFLQRLERIYIERQSLNIEAIGLLLPSDQGGQGPKMIKSIGRLMSGFSSFVTRSKHSKKTSKVLEKLKENLRDEQKLLSEVDYMAFHRLLNTVQGAWAVLGLYPNHCDGLCLLNAVFEQSKSMKIKTKSSNSSTNAY